MAKKKGSARRGARTARAASRGNEPAARESAASLRKALESAAALLHRERRLRPGAIVFRATEQEQPIFTLSTIGSAFEITSAADTEHAAPLLEVIGDPRRIGAIVRGEKDARMQFFAGGIRVRGDMHYLNEIGTLLGFLKKPIV
jgi:hypothetical protein